jgi:peptidoglycan/xylan/chitin deacetylase (PgdA/CDA1 family)
MGARRMIDVGACGSSYIESEAHPAKRGVDGGQNEQPRLELRLSSGLRYHRPRTKRIGRAIRWLGLWLATALVAAVACGGQQVTPVPTPGPSPIATVVPSPTPSSSTPSPTVTPGPTLTPAPSPTPEPLTTSYEVQSGDTLYSISRRFGTTVEAIVAANNLIDPANIYVGQILIIPTEGGTATPTASPGYAQVVSRGDPNQKVVFFTFDAGADAGFTAQILDILAANGIVAGFGVTGRWAEENPDLLRRIVEGGHLLINHSYDHPSFTGLSTNTPPLTQAQRWEQLDETESIINELANVSTKPYFRPPYGDYDESVNADLYARGYLYNVLWTVDSLGWNGLSADKIVERCLAQAEPGAIYEFHVGSASQDADALQAIIDGLPQMGYSIGSMRALITP